MKRVGSTFATMFSIVALGSCTAVGCYEFYNSYITTTPKNIISYHQAATGANAEELATDGKSDEDIATSGDAYEVIATEKIASPANAEFVITIEENEEQ